MFFILRVCLVVGAIFYLSPLREGPTSPKTPVAEAQAFWRDLSAEARKAVVEELRTSAAASLEEAAQRFAGAKPGDSKRP